MGGAEESDLPRDGNTGIRRVSAVGSGANSAIQVIRQWRVMLTDAHERLSDSPCDTYASALGRGSNSSFTSAEADGPGKLLHQEVSLRHRLFGSVRIAHFSSVFNVLVYFKEPSPIHVLREGVENRSRITLESRCKLGGFTGPVA